MKNFFLFGLLLTFSLLAFSADKYVVTKIVMNNNDTIVNLLKFTQLHELQEKIEIKITDSITDIIYPLDAKGFYTIDAKSDTVRFESICGLDFGLADDLVRNCYFLMKIRSGVIPLYYFSRKQLLSMGVSMQIVYQPIYIAKFRGEWTVMSENNYSNQLEKLIKPFKRSGQNNQLKMINSLQSDLYSHKYKFDDIPLFFDRLNEIIK